jgi:hypothetical protein
MMLAKFGDDEMMNERLMSIDTYSLEHGILLKQMASSGNKYMQQMVMDRNCL